MQAGDSCIEALPQQMALLHDLVRDHAQQGTGIAPLLLDDQHLYLYRYWQLEQAVATHIARIKTQSIAALELTAPGGGLASDAQQQEDLQVVAERAFGMVAGAPGTGSSCARAHMIAVIYAALPSIRIAMAAATGKAAQRMKEALQKALQTEVLQQFEIAALQQLQPVTLHRLLGLGTRGQPRFHAKQPLPYDVIVVDEASMLDLSLSQMLL